MRKTAISFGGFVGLVMLMSPASAQDYGRVNEQAYAGTPETLEVIAPRYHRPERSINGAPIIRARMSAPVYIGDLDLRSERDAHRLKLRLVSAATTLCGHIDAAYPGVMEDNISCERYAEVNALQEADAAIHTVRGYPEE
jgi:UrcA family protein